MSHGNYLDRLRFRYRREVCKRFARRPYEFRISRPIVSFSFDDFPVSAATTGGSILRQFGISATYYVSLGLAGAATPASVMFEREDLLGIAAEGHEFGCHTFDHHDAWETDAQTFAASLDRNRAELENQFPGASFQTMSYPISCPRPSVKRQAAIRFTVCRGGGQAVNIDELDRNYVKAFFIEKSRNSLAPIRSMIDQACVANGWLIFVTHDISDHPTPFGCTPRFFEDIVKYAVKSEASILPVSEAWEAIRSQNQPSNRGRRIPASRSRSQEFGRAAFRYSARWYDKS